MRSEFRVGRSTDGQVTLLKVRHTHPGILDLKNQFVGATSSALLDASHAARLRRVPRHALPSGAGRARRRVLRGAVGVHEKVAVGMLLEAFKRDCQVAVGVVHDEDERPVRT